MNGQILTRSPKVWLAVLGVAAITALPVARSVPPFDDPPGNAVTVTQFQLPLEGTTTGLDGESVDWSGTVHLAIHVPPNPIAPVDPCRLYSNLVNVVGIGQTTGPMGLEYRATGGAWSQFDLPVSETLDFTEFYDVHIEGIPPDPIVPPNPIFPVGFTVEFDEAGTPVSASATLDIVT